MASDSHPHEPSLGHPFTIGVLEIDIHIPLCHSLKEKRGVLAKTLNHIRKSQPVSVAEVGSRDVWGRAGLAAVTVSSDPAVADRILRGVVELLEKSREVELVDFSIELF